MKRFIFIGLFFFIRPALYAQDIPIDTSIYTFTVRPVQEQYRTPCGVFATKAAFKYEVLASNYKFPIRYILIVHWCGGTLKVGQTYKIITHVYHKNGIASWVSNHNKEDLYMFEALYVTQELPAIAKD